MTPHQPAWPARWDGFQTPDPLGHHGRGIPCHPSFPFPTPEAHSPNHSVVVVVVVFALSFASLERPFLIWKVDLTSILTCVLACDKVIFYFAFPVDFVCACPVAASEIRCAIVGQPKFREHRSQTSTNMLQSNRKEETGKQKKAFASSFVFIQCFPRQSIVHAY